MGHSCGSLLWDTFIGHSCRTLVCVTLVGNSCGTLVGHSCNVAGQRNRAWIGRCKSASSTSRSSSCQMLLLNVLDTLAGEREDREATLGQDSATKELVVETKL